MWKELLIKGKKWDGGKGFGDEGCEEGERSKGRDGM